MAKVPAVARFNKLVDDISRLYLTARKAQVQFAWETGRRIVQEEQDGEMRAQYGARLIAKLSEVLTRKHGPGFSVTNLKNTRQFYLRYQKSPISGQLDWSDYVELLPVSDEKNRQDLEQRVLKGNLNTFELRRLVRQLRKGSRRTTAPTEAAAIAADADRRSLQPLRGTLYIYRLVQRPALGPDKEARELLLDLGFGIFRDIEPRVAARFVADQIVESRPKEDTYGIYAGERTAKDLFTYNAYVEKVIDGDTLKVRIDLGFEMWNRQVVRLRDIDTPEVGTKAGDAAKAFVQSLLKEAAHVIIRSSRSDKYDRYLADVFIPGIHPEGEGDVFLNNLLITEGHARRVA